MALFWRKPTSSNLTTSFFKGTIGPPFPSQESGGRDPVGLLQGPDVS